MLLVVGRRCRKKSFVLVVCAMWYFVSAIGARKCTEKPWSTSSSMASRDCWWKADTGNLFYGKPMEKRHDNRVHVVHNQQIGRPLNRWCMCDGAHDTQAALLSVARYSSVCMKRFFLRDI